MLNVSATPEPSSSLDSLDDILEQHPFGNSRYITERLHTCYRRRLGKIATHLPVAGQLLKALDETDALSRYRAIGDTVVRCAIQHALTQLETGQQYGMALPQCAQIMREAIRHIRRGTPGPLGSALPNRLGAGPHDSWVWSDDRRDDVFAGAFRHLVHSNYGEHLAVTGAAETAMLQKGAALLDELLPRSARSALSHTHLIAIFPAAGNWASRASSSEFTLSGTIFLSAKLLADPWWVAEHLYHEALHQQLYDFRHGHTLLQPDFERKDAPTICSLWNRPDGHRGNYWDIHRALAAFHVYVHLAILAALAERHAARLKPTYGPIRLNTGSRTAFVRAHYLAEQIKADCWQELGEAGHRFMDWFGTVLEMIELPPPPDGACVHLLLDRYWKEAMEVELLLKENPPEKLLADPLDTLMHTEVDGARRALSASGAGGHLGRFDAALQTCTDQDPARRFVSVRRLIARTIMDASPDGYRLAPFPDADRIVMKMVESSSENLVPLLAR